MEQHIELMTLYSFLFYKIFLGFGFLISIDDIEDSSKLRRGNPVAHSIYGIPQTINTANYVYFLALQKIMALEIPEATKIYMGK